MKLSHLYESLHHTLHENRAILALFRHTRQWQYRAGKTWRRTLGRAVDWPPSPGHFVLGDTKSAVAVCTLSSTALIDQISPKQVAIIGRIYTPNLGLEKMIGNVVSNPRLRYLILCGKESPIFKVGEALLMLAENGLDEHGRIVGATGPMAEVSNLSREAVETFRKQVQLVNHIGEMRPAAINAIIAELAARQTSPYVSSENSEPRSVSAHAAPPIELAAARRQWLDLDPLSYFIINIDRERREIVLERYTTAKKLTHIVRGRAADLIYHTAIRENLLSQYDHAAYLGAELAKAETALYLGLSYEQDKKLVADTGTRSATP